MDFNNAFAAVAKGYAEASEKFGKFNTAHEGYAVLLEEVDELWDEIKCSQRRWSAMQEEAIQVAAMALRFIVDICPDSVDHPF